MNCSQQGGILLQLNKLVARNAKEEQKLKVSAVGKKQVSIASQGECESMIAQMLKSNMVTKESAEPLTRRGVRRQNISV